MSHQLVTEEVKDRIKRSCYADLAHYGLKLIDIDSNINAANDLDYINDLGLGDYLELSSSDFMARVNSVPEADRKKEFERLNSMVKIVNKLSIYWILCNSTRFLVDMDAVMQKQYEPSEDLFKKLLRSGIEDFMFDFAGDHVRCNCRFQKQHGYIRIKGQPHEYYVFTYSRLTTRGSEVGTFELCIVPDLYPKLFVIGELTSTVCKECGLCNKVETARFTRHDGELTDSAVTLLRIPRSIQYTLESKCAYKEVKDEYGPFINHHIKDYLNVCFYAIDRFLNRKIIVKKRNVGIESDPDDAVKVNLDPQEHSQTFVTLRDRVRYERRQRRDLGGHHASPREHVRRATYRHLKDGRIIPIKSCVINKGKGNVDAQTIYKVN